MRADPQRRVTPTLMIRHSRRVGVRRGLRCGRLERSRMPAAPCALAAGPASGRGRRDLEPLRCPSQRPTRLYDAARQCQPAPSGQQSMSVGHEDLRAEERFLDSSTPHWRFPHVHRTPSPTSVVSTSSPSRSSMGVATTDPCFTVRKAASHGHQPPSARKVSVGVPGPLRVSYSSEMAERGDAALKAMSPRRGSNAGGGGRRSRGRRPAAGEPAVPVALLDRPAQVRRHFPLGAVAVRRLTVAGASRRQDESRGQCGVSIR
jgi:hypothetical protein